MPMLQKEGGRAVLGSSQLPLLSSLARRQDTLTWQSLNRRNAGESSKTLSIQKDEGATPEGEG